MLNTDLNVPYSARISTAQIDSSSLNDAPQQHNAPTHNQESMFRRRLDPHEINNSSSPSTSIHYWSNLDDTTFDVPSSGPIECDNRRNTSSMLSFHHTATQSYQDVVFNDESSLTIFPQCNEEMMMDWREDLVPTEISMNGQPTTTTINSIIPWSNDISNENSFSMAYATNGKCYGLNINEPLSATIHTHHNLINPCPINPKSIYPQASSGTSLSSTIPIMTSHQSSKSWPRNSTQSSIAIVTKGTYDEASSSAYNEQRPKSSCGVSLQISNNQSNNNTNNNNHNNNNNTTITTNIDNNHKLLAASCAFYSRQNDDDNNNDDQEAKSSNRILLYNCQMKDSSLRSVPLQPIDDNSTKSHQNISSNYLDNIKNNIANQKENSLSYQISNPLKTKENPKKAFSVFNSESLTDQYNNISVNNCQTYTSGNVVQTSRDNNSSCLSNDSKKLFFDMKTHYFYNFITMYQRQFEFMPSEFFMFRQKDITSSMRYKLVDWIIEVVDELCLKRQTLFLCINIIDRFLSKLKIQRSKLQLLGTTALLVASKFEEIHPHPVKMFAHLTENSYTETEILNMERIILRTIKFDLCIPSLENFAEFAFKSIQNSNSYIRSFVNYIEEIIMVEYNVFSPHPPSHLALAAVVLSLHCLDEYPWPDALQNLAQVINITFNDLLPSIFDIYKHLCAARDSSNSIFIKYTSPLKQSVADVILPQTLPILMPLITQDNKSKILN